MDSVVTRCLVANTRHVSATDVFPRRSTPVSESPGSQDSRAAVAHSWVPLGLFSRFTAESSTRPRGGPADSSAGYRTELGGFLVASRQIVDLRSENRVRDSAPFARGRPARDTLGAFRRLSPAKQQSSGSRGNVYVRSIDIRSALRTPAGFSGLFSSAARREKHYRARTAPLNTSP